MSAPELTLTKAADGLSWSAVFSGIEGLADKAAAGPDAATAAASARRLARDAIVEAAKAEGLTVGPAQLAALELRLRHAASLALARLAPGPPPPATDPYGTDVSTFPGLDPLMRLTKGTRAIAESVARRLLTPRGFFDHAPDDGLDVRSLWHEGLSDSRLAALRGQIEAEALKDDRLSAVDVELVSNPSTQSLAIRLRLTPLTGQAFRLVLTVSKLATNVDVLKA